MSYHSYSEGIMASGQKTILEVASQASNLVFVGGKKGCAELLHTQGVPLTRNATNYMEKRTLQSVKQFTLEKKNKGACCPFLGQHRSARVSTMMVLAFHNTWSPAGARLTAPGAEVLTEIKLLEGVLITQVSGYRECLLLLSKTLEVMVSSAVSSVLCSNH